MKTMVKGTEQNGEEVESFKDEIENSIEGFNGKEITENEFKKDMLNLIGQSVTIELRLKTDLATTLITAKCYEDLELDLDENRGELIFNNSDDSIIPFMALPLDDVDVICRGYGFMDEDKWVVRIKGGLEYFIWLEM